MAIHSKKININSTSNQVAFTGSIGATDLQVDVFGDGSELYDPEFRTIQSVHNFSGASVTFGGFTFAPGNWDFSVSGGLKMAAALTGAITGSNNCIIVLRT